MSDPGIVRVNRAPSSFFTAHKGPFEDTRLSWEAKGMMAYLLTHPEGWQISIVDLVKASPAKGDKVSSIIKELEGFFYVRRERIQKSDGRFQWVSNVYEDPTMNPNFPPVSQVKSPKTGKNVDSSDLTIPPLTTDGRTIDGRTIDGETGYIVKNESSKNKTTKEDSLKANSKGLPKLTVQASDLEFDSGCSNYRDVIYKARSVRKQPNKRERFEWLKVQAYIESDDSDQFIEWCIERAESYQGKGFIALFEEMLDEESYIEWLGGSEPSGAPQSATPVQTPHKAKNGPTEPPGEATRPVTPLGQAPDPKYYKGTFA